MRCKPVAVKLRRKRLGVCKDEARVEDKEEVGALKGGAVEGGAMERRDVKGGSTVSNSDGSRLVLAVPYPCR